MAPGCPALSPTRIPPASSALSTARRQAACNPEPQSYCCAPALKVLFPTPCAPAQQNVVMTATKKDGALDMALKSTYTAPKYTLVSTFSQAGKVGVGGSHVGDGARLRLGGGRGWGV